MKSRNNILGLVPVCVGVIALAGQTLAAGNPAQTNAAAGLTAEQVKAAQTIVSDTCNACHASEKPITATLLKKHAPSRMTGHFKKKADLTDEQVKLMVDYLSAVRDGRADLPEAAVTNAKTNAPATSRKHRRGDDDDEDDEGSDD